MHRSLFAHRWIVAGLLSLWLSRLVLGADPLVGKRVVVIKDNAPLAASGKELAKASECTVFTVDKVDGEWLWIKSEKAYLRRADVVPFEDAIGHYTRLLETNKTANNYWHRAQIWRLKGELDIALGDMNDAIRLNSTESAWFGNRGILWHDKKEYDKAIADYGEAIRLNPKSSDVYSNRARAWTAKKDYDKAIADYDAALKYTDPNRKVGTHNGSDITGGDSTTMVNSRALNFSNRGEAWSLKGDYVKAIADFEEAIRLDPKFLSPRSYRRVTWERKGDWDKIVADCDVAILENAGDAEAWNQSAWQRATCPDEKLRDGQKAVEYSTKACELKKWKDANYLDTLAAAYAEAGDFDKAVEWQQKGMDLAPADQKADYATRVKLYRDKKPYRQPAP